MTTLEQKYALEVLISNTGGLSYNAIMSALQEADGDSLVAETLRSPMYGIHDVEPWWRIADMEVQDFIPLLESTVKLFSDYYEEKQHDNSQSNN